ncbi:endothelin-converting enzyme 1-like [Paramuricea clavata]|uniref:Endothelin-converting enzyme 1-like n=1 Tax=Paramuricea clavata TaxID=317549 RepID=A0A6S7LQ78_PARCT
MMCSNCSLITLSYSSIINLVTCPIRFTLTCAHDVGPSSSSEPLFSGPDNTHPNLVCTATVTLFLTHSWSYKHRKTITLANPELSAMLLYLLTQRTNHSEFSYNLVINVLVNNIRILASLPWWYDSQEQPPIHLETVVSFVLVLTCSSAFKISFIVQLRKSDPLAPRVIVKRRDPALSRFSDLGSLSHRHGTIPVVDAHLARCILALCSLTLEYELSVSPFSSHIVSSGVLMLLYSSLLSTTIKGRSYSDSMVYFDLVVVTLAYHLSPEFPFPAVVLRLRLHYYLVPRQSRYLKVSRLRLSRSAYLSAVSAHSCPFEAFHSYSLNILLSSSLSSLLNLCALRVFFFSLSARPTAFSYLSRFFLSKSIRLAWTKCCTFLSYTARQLRFVGTSDNQFKYYKLFYIIPAGILQEPFFYSGSIPKALSYGAIGHVLGHELTHGFDDTGRTFNLIGKKVLFKETGWSNVSDRNFKKEEKCLVKQFNGYKVLGKFHVNGKMTLGENIADAGGLTLAFNAYKRWINDHGEEKVLPCLDKNSDELFFIGFAQKDCANTSPAGQFMAVQDDDYAPAKYR